MSYRTTMIYRNARDLEALRTERDELLHINEKYVEEISLLRAFAEDEQRKRHEAEEKLMAARSEIELLSGLSK